MRLEEIPIDKVIPNEGNIRRELGSVTELAASIRARGILEPLVVAASEHDNTYSLIAGHRRLAAAQKAKLPTVPCRVLDAMSRAEELELMLVENLQRSDLTAVEEGTAYQQLLAFPDMDVDRIRKATGRSATTIRARLKLMDLPAAAVERVHKGQISLVDAAKLTEFADEPAVVEWLAKELGGYNFTYSLQSAKARAKKMKEAEAAGAVVLTDEAQLESHPGARKLPWDTKPGPGLLMLFPPTYSYGSAWTTQPEAETRSSTDEDATTAGQAGQPNLSVVHPTSAPNPNAAGSMVEKREAAEARDTLAQASAQRELAANTRQEYIRSLLTEKKLRPAAVQHGLRDAIWSIIDNQHRAMELLDVMPDIRPGWLDVEQCEQLGRPRTDQMDTPQLVLLLVALDLSSLAFEGIRLADPTALHPPQAEDLVDLRAAVRWFDFLVSMGYELNDVDTAQLAAIEANIALLQETGGED